MSRHRNIRKLNIEEELAEDDDADYYGRSLDEDEPLTPGTFQSQFIYSRRPLTYAVREEIVDHDAPQVDDRRGGGSVTPLAKPSPTAPKTGGESSSSSRPTNKPLFRVGEPKSKPPKKEPEKKPQSAPVVAPNIENLRVSETKLTRGNSKSPARMTPNSSFQRLSALDAALATPVVQKTKTRPADATHSINLVIVGHVDAGKSTLIGHLLYLLGAVDDRTMHKNRQESSQSGKASFAFAWLLDEAEEERQRGVTMDIARAAFRSPLRADRIYNILDAPGHKDFIPNMITGASQADAALLVINATRGEFETGFDLGGQTREHALLLRSLGVTKIVAAINKLDTFDWSEERFEEVCASLRPFLQKQAGFENVKFVPVSGLAGVNLIERPPANHPLACWHSDGPSLIEALDQLPAPNRSQGDALRIVVNDVIRLTATALTLAGKVESGYVEAGDKLYLMPEANPVLVKTILPDDGPATANQKQTQQQLSTPQQPGGSGFAGDQILLSVTGSFEPDSIYPGHVLCRGGADLLVPLKRFQARIVVFDIRVPILKGTRAELFAHSTRAPCVITQLRCVLNKATRTPLKQNPRVLTRNMSASVVIESDVNVNIEPHPKTLCRFTLRVNGETVCAGVVEKAL